MQERACHSGQEGASLNSAGFFDFGAATTCEGADAVEGKEGRLLTVATFLKSASLGRANQLRGEDGKHPQAEECTMALRQRLSVRQTFPEHGAGEGRTCAVDSRPTDEVWVCESGHGN